MRLRAAGALLLGCSAGGVPSAEPTLERGATPQGGAAGAPDSPALAAPAGRLRALAWISEDGTRQPTGTWRDTARDGEECAFALAADGLPRCLPTALGVAVGYFRDSGCTVRLFVTGAGCGAEYAGELDSSTCPARARRFALTPIARPESVWAGESCLSTPAPAAFDYFTGVEVPAAEFAAGELRAD